MRNTTAVGSLKKNGTDMASNNLKGPSYNAKWPQIYSYSIKWFDRIIIYCQMSFKNVVIASYELKIPSKTSNDLQLCGSGIKWVEKTIK